MKSGVQDISLEAIHVVQLKQLFKLMLATKDKVTKVDIEMLEARLSIGSPTLSNDPAKPYSEELTKIRDHFFSQKMIFQLIRAAAVEADPSDLQRFIKELLHYRTDEFINAAQFSEAVLIMAIGLADSSVDQNRYLTQLQRNHLFGLDVLDEYFGTEFVNHLLAQQRTFEDENFQLILAELLADNEPLPEAGPSDENLLFGFTSMRISNQQVPALNNTADVVEAHRSSEHPAFPPKL